jgi:Spy/CpxP family protein refolding chaperone
MNRVQTCLLALSLGLNLAFGGIWLVHILKQNPLFESDQAAHSSLPSSLHREIGVLPDQWKQISILIENFRQASRIQGRKIRILRCRLLDLLEAPNPDRKVIETTQKQLYALNLDMKKKAVTLLLGEKEFLSPDQYRSLIKEIRKRSNCVRENGHNGGSFMQVLSRDPVISGN